MWKWLQTLRPNRSVPTGQAHMTFGQTTFGRTISRTQLLLKRQLWIWPIIAVVLLTFVAYGISRSIESTMRATLQSGLQTLLHVERAMLEKWFHVQESSAASLANDLQVRHTVAQILELDAGSTGRTEERSAVEIERDRMTRQAELRKELASGMASHDFDDFVIADKRQRIVASTNPELVGRIVPEYEAFLTRALEGEPTVSPPFRSVAVLVDRAGKQQIGAPTMFVCAPIRDDAFQVIGALCFRMRPDREFTSILQLGRIGDSGETYAVNKAGTLVSNSRFDADLILLGLLPDVDSARSILNIELRDPGGNMVEGYRPGVRRRDLPLTTAAASLAAGQSEVSLDPARDYRGVPVVAAWEWLPKYDIGLITKLDAEEAYRPLTILKRAFYVVHSLLAVGALAIFIFTIIVARLRREAQRAEVEAKQLGQYRLEDKIGAGAMGVVYRGHHAMLCRPTAVKMLNVERVNEASIKRFEREVQTTSKLNNPHTVAIYDYGRTPEGVFYYAMEYLDGINLQTLVERYGPQPEGRVVSILAQICGSLFEAHSLGLVHRDIKPANIMLNRRGGEPDVVKVLDFGLVVALDERRDGRDAENSVSGTPLYMSPEAIQSPESVDGRSDLYAVGAVGYFLLTGRTAFQAQSFSDLCREHLTSVPMSPSERLGRAISPELEHAILACLEKTKAKRPQTARDLATMLGRVRATWTLEDAEAWWSRHERGGPAANGTGGPLTGDTSLAGSASRSQPTTASSQLDRTMQFGSEDDA
jgi:serine/threonine protein kinase